MLHNLRCRINIGDLPVEMVHIGTLQPFIAAKKRIGRKHRITLTLVYK